MAVKMLKGGGLETGLCVDNYFSQIDNNIVKTRAKNELLRGRKTSKDRKRKGGSGA